MSKIINFNEVENRVLVIRDQQVLLDRDVAELYGVETKEINQAVGRNQEKFPKGYIITLTQEECDFSRSQIVTLNGSGRGHNIKYLPKAFTEKGLYMLATILKGSTATQTTIAIVETFAKVREVSRILSQLPDAQDESTQKGLLEKTGSILAEVIDDNTLTVSGTETTVELNLAIMKLKHTVKREKHEE